MQTASYKAGAAACIVALSLQRLGMEAGAVHDEHAPAHVLTAQKQGLPSHKP